MSTVTIAPHLWRALELMSKDMGVEPAALTNQAVFAWLRINGYVLPGTAAAAAQPTTPAQVLARAPEAAASIPEEPPTSPAPMALSAAAAPAPLPAAAARPASSPALAPVARPGSSGVLTPVAEKSAEKVVARAPEPPMDPAARVLLRISEIDAALERQTHPRSAWAKHVEAPEEEEEAEAPEPAPEPAEDQADQGAADTGDDAPLDEPPPTEFTPTGEAPITTPPARGKDEEEPPPERTVFVRSAPTALFIQRENEEPIPVLAERFIIGRGPQCNLVIDSPRVSREHVAITRKGVIFMLDDLGSSNGTWFNAERVTSRELEDGDTILLGNEAVTFHLRAEA